MTQEKFPLFYKEPTILNKNVHGKLTIGKSPKGFAFAANTFCCILAPVEFIEACKEYPIIFSTTPEQKIVPMALLGFREGENLFVDEEGNWKARYIPAYVRRYPFILSETGTADLNVCIDNAYDGLNAEDGAPVFDEEGGYSAYMQQVLEFLRNFHVQFQGTEAFTDALNELDLFKSMDAMVELKDGKKFSLKGFQVIDEQKLLTLSEEDVYKLFKSGYLALIYAHLLSLSMMSVMVDKLAERTPAE